MGGLTFEDKLTAKLLVLIEGIADHQMSEHNSREFIQEVLRDIRTYVRGEQ